MASVATTVMNMRFVMAPPSRRLITSHMGLPPSLNIRRVAAR
jgi:hypothetical protein